MDQAEINKLIQQNKIDELVRRVTDIDQDEIHQLGASLRRINQASLKPREDGHTRVWYQGGESYFDIFLDLQGEEIAWFQITLRGKSLSWHRQQARLKTGTTDEFEVNLSYAANKTIEEDLCLNTQFVEHVQAILRTRPDEFFLKEILTLIDQAQARAV